ncbi:MAG TPA: hypothetical protein PKY22_03075, partial [Accumulibacter sp.]|nr:hypothetical protein [Accumulibacter sp.]
LFTQDDGGAYVESGRIRLLDSAGNLVKEGGFHAQNPGGTLAVTLHSDLAFSAVEINAGVYDTANTFIYGGYAQADGSFASGVLTDTLGGKHGSDFLVDKIDFQVPLSTVPLDVFIV